MLATATLGCLRNGRQLVVGTHIREQPFSRRLLLGTSAITIVHMSHGLGTLHLSHDVDFLSHRLLLNLVGMGEAS